MKVEITVADKYHVTTVKEVLNALQSSYCTDLSEHVIVTRAHHSQEHALYQLLGRLQHAGIVTTIETIL